MEAAGCRVGTSVPTRHGLSHYSMKAPLGDAIVVVVVLVVVVVVGGAVVVVGGAVVVVVVGAVVVVVLVLVVVVPVPNTACQASASCWPVPLGRATIDDVVSSSTRLLVPAGAGRPTTAWRRWRCARARGEHPAASD